MNKKEVGILVEKYSRGDKFDPEGFNKIMDFNFSHQYDNRSADINYAMVRHFKPQVVAEFGTFNGRCTFDILQALLKNKQPFVFKPYEINNDHRQNAQMIIDKKFGKHLVSIGGDIREAQDIPDNIDYLFIDNNHDRETTEWVFNVLLKKCALGALVHFHDMSLHENWEIKEHIFEDLQVVLDMHKKGILPLEKLYWTWEEGNGQESTWWRYKP